SVREFDTSTNVHFKSVESWARGEEKKSAGMSDEEYAAKIARAQQAYGQYQSQSVDTIRGYLAHLAESPEAMEALRQSSQMYSDLGTYSDQNQKGLVGGRLEADHRAMNDMLLRSFGADSQISARAAKDTGLGAEEQDRIGVITQAILSMQATNLAQSMDPTNQLTPQEAEMGQLFSDFFAQLHGDAPAGPAQQSAAPAPAPAQQPFTPGQKTSKETFLYRTDEAGEMAKDLSKLDPSSPDPMVNAAFARYYYDKLKELQKSGASKEEIEETVLHFKEACARMGSR
ncbi:MAG: hypothetical protein K5697_09670, partial [Lachnospiraceae bacterium]|nr:hypothetical protein [Lachnospiraceae bacterium]